MKRKFLITLLFLACMFACVCIIAACETNESEKTGGHEHNLTFNNRVEADCENDGNIAYWYCPSCDIYYSDSKGNTEIQLSDTVLSKLGHIFKEGFTTDKQPTCTQSGSKSKHCTRCDEKDEITPISELGHDFEEEFTTDEQPTCTENGSKSKHCTRCDEKKEVTSISELGHDFEEEFTTDEQPTCTESGSKSKHCIRCNERTEEMAVAALGHDWTQYSTSETQHWHSCRRCEKSERGDHVGGNECSVCYFIKTGTEGLQYELNVDRTNYTVIGIGKATESVIVIPSVYNDLPVTGIATEAFAGCEFITEVTIPESITSLGRSAFACPQLTRVNFNAVNCQITDKLERFNGTFSPGFDLDITVYVGSSVTVMPEYFFQGFTESDDNFDYVYIARIKEIIFAKNSKCKLIEKNIIFELSVSTLNSINIPKSVTSIDQYSFRFSGSKQVETITVESNNPAYYSENNCLIERATGKLLIGCNNSIIPDGVKSIGRSAFNGCSALTSIIIPNGVTSIGSQVFYDCNSLTSITIPDSVTIIEDLAFDGCNLLTIYCEAESKPNDWGANWNKYNYGGYCPIVWSCKDNDKDENGYAYVVIEGIRYSLKDNKATVLRQRNNINEANIPATVSYKNQTYSVTRIEDSAFSNCSLLTRITIPESVANIGSNVFYNCRLLVIYNEVKSKPDGWGESWNNNCPVVWNCKNNDKDENGYTYALIDGIRYSLKDNVATVIMQSLNITEANIPMNVKYKNVLYNVTRIGEKAFFDCRLLTSISIPDSIINIGHAAFDNCSLLEFTEYDNCLYLGNETNRYVALIRSKDISITSCIIHDGTRIICGNAFNNCRMLTNITIPDSIVSKESAFYNCPIETATISASAIVIIPKQFLKTVIITGGKSIGDYAFNGCSALTSITISDSVTSIGNYAFSGCSSLENIIIPNSVISIGNYVFENCNKLSSITLPFIGANKDGTEYTNLGYLFGGNSYDDNSYFIPSSLKTVILSDGATEIGQRAFYGCSSLESISIPGSIINIGEDALSGCEGIDIYYKGNIAKWCGINGIGNLFNFGNNNVYIENKKLSDMDNIIIHAGVTSIQSYAFSYCNNLTSIVIPHSVTSISHSVFTYCKSLTIYCEAESKPSGWEENWNQYYVQYYYEYCPVIWDCKNNDYDGNGFAYAVMDGIRYSLKDNNAIVSRQQINIAKANIPASVFYNNQTYRVTGIENSAFRGCSSLTEIIIPDSVTSIGEHAFNGCGSLTKIIIPDGVTTIGEYAFNGCGSLIEITIPDGVKDISESMFRECSSLESVIIPNGVTNIGNYAFMDCASIIEIIIPDGVASIGYRAFSNCGLLKTVIFGKGVTNIKSYTFYGCSSLESITIPDGVESIGNNAFEGCGNLKSVTLPDSVESIKEKAFLHCDILKGNEYENCLYLGNEKNKYIYLLKVEDKSKTSCRIHDDTKIVDSAAFDKCNFETATIPSVACSYIANSVLKTVVITSGESIGDRAFENCSSLISISISDGITSIGRGAFHNCRSLTSIIIPDGVTSIESSAFENCNSLTSITIPNGVTSIGNYAFQSCRTLTIYCEVESKPNGWINDWKDYSCPVIWDCKNNDKDQDGYEYAVINEIRYSLKDDFATVIGQPYNIIQAIIPETVTYKDKPFNVTSIANNAFGNCNSLITVTIPNSVTSIGTSVFRGCSSLTIFCEAESRHDGWDSSWNNNCPVVWNYKNNDKDQEGYEYAVIDGIRYSLKDDLATVIWQSNNIIQAIIPETVTYKNKIFNVTSIANNAFTNCNSLTTVIIPDGVTSIGTFAFSGCSSLKSVTLPNSVTCIKENTFNGCSSLESITIPDSVTIIEDWAFNDCSSLKSIAIPDRVTSIGYYVFSGCPIETATIPAFACKYINRPLLKTVVITSGESIEYRAFYNCNSLESITISDSVTSIEDEAFSGCHSLSSIIMGNGVTSIGDSAFSSCSSLESITIPDSVISIGDYAFSSCSLLKSIIIPDSVTKIKPNAFIFCSIETATIPAIACKYINSSLLRTVVITSGESIEYRAFENCNSLESITISNSVTSIKDKAFSGCCSLTSITIPDSVKEIGRYAFKGCSSLISVAIGDGVTNIWDSAFENCFALTSVTIGNSVTSIGDSAFDGCNSLTNINIPESVTSIGERAFRNCSSLTNIIIPNNMTYIRYYTFIGCSSLTSVTISENVTIIEVRAFENCNSLTSINFSGTKEQWNAIEKMFCWITKTGDFTVHCIDGDIAK